MKLKQEPSQKESMGFLGEKAIDLENPQEDATKNLTHAVMNLTRSIEELQSKLDSLDTPKTHEIDPELKEIEKLKYLPILNKKETAHVLRVSERSLERWMQDGSISYSKKNGATFFKAEDIEQFIDSYKIF